ncbi:hypothetical protein pb186bvf_001542 [Paramecium bursaria]
MFSFPFLSFRMGNTKTMKFEYNDFFQIANSQMKQETFNQQKILQQYYCTIAHHYNKSIEGICLNITCRQQNRRACVDCIMERVHDSDDGKLSLVKNADQVELIIENLKQNLINQIDVCQFQLFYHQLKFCDEASDYIATKMFEQLEKINYDLKQVSNQIDEINFKSYIAEQYETNKGLFQYLKGYQANIIKVSNQLKEYKGINFLQKFPENQAQQFQVDQNVIDDMQAIRKKKLFIINSILKTNYCKDGRLNDDQIEYLIIQNDPNIKSNYQQEIMIDNYDLLFKMYPKNEEFYIIKGILQQFLIGNKLSKMKKFEQSIILYDQAIKLKPQNSWYYNVKGMKHKYLGTSLYQIQKYEQSIYMFDQAIKLEPKQSIFYRNKGNRQKLQQQGDALYQMEKYELAITMYDQGRLLDPNNATYINNKGLALFKLQQYEYAKAVYNQAIKINPNESAYYQNQGYKIYQQQGDTLFHMKRYDQSIQMYNNALYLQPKAVYYSKKGLVYIQIQQYQQAIDIFDQAILLEPNEADHYNKKGDALKLQQNYEQSIALYDQAIKLNPKQYIYYSNKGI